MCRGDEPGIPVFLARDHAQLLLALLAEKRPDIERRIRRLIHVPQHTISPRHRFFRRPRRSSQLPRHPVISHADRTSRRVQTDVMDVASAVRTRFRVADCGPVSWPRRTNELEESLHCNPFNRRFTAAISNAKSSHSSHSCEISLAAGQSGFRRNQFITHPTGPAASPHRHVATDAARHQVGTPCAPPSPGACGSPARTSRRTSATSH